MFADHENLGINFLILKIYWVFMEIWGKYHFLIMAPTKWPPFWPEGEIDVAPYPKTFIMTKGMSVPSFMLVPQNARFFHISLGLLVYWRIYASLGLNELTKVFYISDPNLVILTWTGHELPCRQARDWNTWMQATTIAEGQFWPQVKIKICLFFFSNKIQIFLFPKTIHIKSWPTQL